MPVLGRLASNRKGFTILEIMVTTFISGVILTTAIPSLSTAVNAHQLQSALRSATGYVRVVRATAVSKNLSSRLVVSEDGHTLSTEVNKAGLWTTTGSPVYLGSTVGVSAISPVSGLSFTSQGTASAATTITIQTSRGDMHTITVALLGSVGIS